MGILYFIKTMNFNDDFLNSTDNLLADSYLSNQASIYSGFIPRTSIHDQIQIGQNALGKAIYLDTGRF